MVVYGDMGTTNDMFFDAIKSYVENNKVDLLWHVGDFCYNMDEMDGNILNKSSKVMKKIQD